MKIKILKSGLVEIDGVVGVVEVGENGEQYLLPVRPRPVRCLRRRRGR